MKIARDGVLFNSYIKVLEGRLFKILPLFQEENEGLFKYIESLLFELYGVQECVEGVNGSASYISILGTLESIYTDVLIGDLDDSFVKSEVFRMLSLLNNLQKGD